MNAMSESLAESYRQQWQFTKEMMLLDMSRWPENVIPFDVAAKLCKAADKALE